MPLGSSTTADTPHRITWRSTGRAARLPSAPAAVGTGRAARSGLPRGPNCGLPAAGACLYDREVTTAGFPSAQDPVARSGLSPERLVALYRLMALARALDERTWILNRSGRVHFVISGQGHEGAEAGVTAALTPGRDWFLPYYRSMTGVMAMGMTPRDVFLLQYGKADDPGSGGRQMPSHYGHADHRIFTSSSPVGTQILHAAGIALAAKLRGKPEVALVAMGEGSSNQGDVHEALNFAGVHRLPMILLVENNGYAISVPAERETAVRDIAVRAAR
jgi:2-oxoisovalerate dehydrogenase E1 component alpha subunit